VRPNATLVRLVRRPDGKVIVDSKVNHGGRGAYVCDDAGCQVRGLERGRLAHAFKKPCEVEATLAGEVRERWQLAR
jgi:predicted RNA-binding protein YlxR (DUF448 family)